MKINKIILDRSYAFYLLDYLSRIAGKTEKAAIDDMVNKEFLNETIDVINHALILFETILIEDYYGSSLYHLAGKLDWFWKLFETYSPDSVAANDPTLTMLVEESVASDLKDASLRKIVQTNLPPRYLEIKHYESLIWNINRTLLSAKILDAAILPWPDKIPLYKYKFDNSLCFYSGEKIHDMLSTVLEFQAPGYAIKKLEDLVLIRDDERVVAFRRLLWDLASDVKIGNYADILQKMEDEKAKIATILKPSLSRLIRSIVSSPIPFPLSVALQSVYDIIDLRQIKPYSWYFLLLEMREQAKGKQQDNRE